MTKEAFEQDILEHIREHRLLHRCVGQADVVKFVFQAMLGVGHMLPSREQAACFIARETEGLKGDAGEPLFEELSPAWCRLNLRRAVTEQIPPSVIAGLMAASHTQEHFTRRDVYDFCASLGDRGEAAVTDTGLLNSILDESWLPSHSEAYREQNRPAYRVVSPEWITYIDAVRETALTMASAHRPLITIDGPCASGKTTLAQRLAEVFGAQVIHTDDFVIPHALKTAERLAVPGGNCDAERLVKEAVRPWKQGLPVKYRRYDCHLDRLLPEETLPESRLLIIEGSYCGLPAIRGCADLCLFVNTPEEVREARLARRESPESLRRFHERWIPLENAYFTEYGLPDGRCVTVRGFSQETGACAGQ